MGFIGDVATVLHLKKIDHPFKERRWWLQFTKTLKSSTLTLKRYKQFFGAITKCNPKCGASGPILAGWTEQGWNEGNLLTTFIPISPSLVLKYTAAAKSIVAPSWEAAADGKKTRFAAQIAMKELTAPQLLERFFNKVAASVKTNFTSQTKL